MKGMHLLGIGLFLGNCLITGCRGQNPPPVTQTSSVTNESKIVGGHFENREYMYIGMPENIPSVDTSKGWYQDGQKLLITGTIFQRDGKTPAPGVILIITIQMCMDCMPQGLILIKMLCGMAI